MMRARFKEILREPKRYAVLSAIFWATWMMISMTVRDAISHRTITLASIIGAAILCAFGGIGYGWFAYHQRIR